MNFIYLDWFNLYANVFVRMWIVIAPGTRKSILLGYNRNLCLFCRFITNNSIRKDRNTKSPQKWLNGTAISKSQEEEIMKNIKTNIALLLVVLHVRIMEIVPSIS